MVYQESISNHIDFYENFPIQSEYSHESLAGYFLIAIIIL